MSRLRVARPAAVASLPAVTDTGAYVSSVEVTGTARLEVPSAQPGRTSSYYVDATIRHAADCLVRLELYHTASGAAEKSSVENRATFDLELRALPLLIEALTKANALYERHGFSHMIDPDQR